MMKLDYKKIEYIKDLLFELTKKEIKVRYKNNYLGYLWSVLSPLTLALVFFFAFKIIMRVQIENYALFLIAGLFPWQFTANSINTSAVAFIGNASIVKKIFFPRDMLIYSLILNELIHFLLSIPVIMLFLFMHAQIPSIWWLVELPPLLISQFLLLSGFSIAIASGNLFFRDCERLVGIFTNLLFYLTPIIYSIDMIPEKYRIYLMLNPFAPLILAYKGIFLEGVFNAKYFFLSFLWGITVFFLGRLVYNRLKWKFAEVL